MGKVGTRGKGPLTSPLTTNSHSPRVPKLTTEGAILWFPGLARQ